MTSSPGKFKKWFYLKEFKELSITAFFISAAFFFYHFGHAIKQWLLSADAQSAIVLGMACIVICVVIKLYYRVMVIKYYEKDTNIRLFEEKNQIKDKN